MLLNLVGVNFCCLAAGLPRFKFYAVQQASMTFSHTVLRKGARALEN